MKRVLNKNVNTLVRKLGKIAETKKSLSFDISHDKTNKSKQDIKTEKAIKNSYITCYLLLVSLTILAVLEGIAVGS